MLSATELAARALLGFAYMGSFLIFLFGGIVLWDKYQERKRRKAYQAAERAAYCAKDAEATMAIYLRKGQAFYDSV